MNLNTKNTGNLGEELSAKWFEANGYTILERNWRFKKSEVDIIATKNNTLHFIEVKTRSNINLGLPEDSIDSRKMNALKRAAVAYLEMNTQWINFQFDVFSILLNQNKPHDYFLIEDVFF
jgi:putative endonuclease